MIKINGRWFNDEHGRTLLLRGVNLGGSTKVPYQPNGATYNREGFFDHKQVSFVGRPFPLEEADEHFSRLKAWGLTFVRFLVTWEAIEHTGPGIYDEAYLDYVQAIVEKAYEHGITLFIDPHQDVWSRFSGGDGAPAWTFDAVGMDITKFKETGAAIVHQTHGDPFPRMIWPSNYAKLAAGTMFTLFFGGNDFAPKTLINGEPAQEFLQRHYINAVKQVVSRLKGTPNVLGYDTMNEPFHGYIGWEDLNTSGGVVRLGDTPTPFQAMALGSGYTQDVEQWALIIFRRGTKRLDPQGMSVWKNECLWKQNGIWDIGTDGHPRLLRPRHFAYVNGHKVDFLQDYMRPFILRFAREIRETDPNAMIFIEAEASQAPPYLAEDGLTNVVYAPHWYDGLTLLTKRFIPGFTVDAISRRPAFGREAVRRSFVQQLGRNWQWSKDNLNDVPVVIGETGIPFDMHNKEAFRTGDFSKQIAALDNTMQALEANLLNFTLWNYTPDNTNERGDLWNDEDLSLFSRDQQDNRLDINSGGRALKAAVRPYARAIAGEPLRMGFDIERGLFEFVFRHDPKISAPTELFVPDLQFPDGYRVEVSDGEFESDMQNQTLIYHHNGKDVPHRIRIISNTPLQPPQPASNMGWGAWLGMLAFVWWVWRGRKKS